MNCMGMPVQCKQTITYCRLFTHLFYDSLFFFQRNFLRPMKILIHKSYRQLEKLRRIPIRHEYRSGAKPAAANTAAIRISKG